MTPFQIDILLWYYCRAEDYRGPMLASPVFGKVIEDLVSQGLLARNTGDAGQALQGTERLNVYAKALCGVPLPVQEWVIPDEA